jgi:putative chitinase
MKFDIQAFLTAYESELGKLKSSQKQGLEFLVGKINNDKPFDMLERVAYFLATIYWESGRTFQPVREKRAGTHQVKVRALQDRYWHTGAYGRGYVQITWPENYEKFGLKKREDYDRALEPLTAYTIATIGMEQGEFAKDKLGRKHTLARYIKKDKIDYIGARRIINGTDKAEIIAGVAMSMERILRKALVQKIVEVNPGPGQDKTLTPTPVEPPKESFIDSLPSVSATSVKRAGSTLFKSLAVRIGAALTVGDYLKLSIYVLLIIAIVVIAIHYRKRIKDEVIKLLKKVK